MSIIIITHYLVIHFILSCLMVQILDELACTLQIHLFTMNKCSTRSSLTIW